MRVLGKAIKNVAIKFDGIALIIISNSISQLSYGEKEIMCMCERVVRPPTNRTPSQPQRATTTCKEIKKKIETYKPS